MPLIGNRLALLRKRRGLSQEELAERARLDRSYVSRIERGLANPSMGVLERICVALDITLQELFCTPEEEHSGNFKGQNSKAYR